MTPTTDTGPRRPGPKLPELSLSDDERATLSRWARRRTSSQALALRCRIVLASAEGHSNQAVADRLGVSKPTVTKWRARFLTRRLEGLADEPRPGAARRITDEQVEQVLVATLEATPADATHWSTRSAGPPARHVAVGHQPDLAGVRAQAAPGRHLQAVAPIRSSSTRSATSSGCTSTRLRRPWCCAWTRRPRCRPWTAPPRSCRCCPGRPSGPPTTTSATAPPTCTPPWTWPPATSSPR